MPRPTTTDAQLTKSAWATGQQWSRGAPGFTNNVGDYGNVGPGDVFGDNGVLNADNQPWEDCTVAVPSGAAAFALPITQIVQAAQWFENGNRSCAILLRTTGTQEICFKEHVTVGNRPTVTYTYVGGATQTVSPIADASLLTNSAGSQGSLQADFINSGNTPGSNAIFLLPAPTGAITSAVFNGYKQGGQGGTISAWQVATPGEVWASVSPPTISNINGSTSGNARTVTAIATSTAAVTAASAVIPGVGTIALNVGAPTGNDYPLSGTFTGLAAGSYDPGTITATNSGGTSSPGVLPGFTIGGLNGGGEPVATDTTAPTFTITTNVTGTATGPFTATLTASEAVTGFASGDIGVTNGAAGTFTAVSASVYTLVITPPANATGTTTINVAAGVCQDAAGNPNVAASRTQAYNTQAAPVITTSSVTLPANGSFQLVATGTAPITWAVQSGSLPSGVTLSTTGLLNSANGFGVSNAVFVASNAAGSATRSIGISVSAAINQLVIVGAQDTSSAVGSSGSWIIETRLSGTPVNGQAVTAESADSSVFQVTNAQATTAINGQAILGGAVTETALHGQQTTVTFRSGGLSVSALITVIESENGDIFLRGRYYPRNNPAKE